MDEDRDGPISPDWWAVLDADVPTVVISEDPCDGPVLPGHYADDYKPDCPF